MTGYIMKVHMKNNRIVLYLFGKYLFIIYHDNSINNSLVYVNVIDYAGVLSSVFRLLAD